MRILFQRQPASKEDKKKKYWVFQEDVERIFWEVMKENKWKLEDFAAEESKEEQSISSSFYIVPSKTVKRIFNENVERIFWKAMKENNWKPEDFAAEETKEDRSVSSSNDVVHSENVKPGKNLRGYYGM